MQYLRESIELSNPEVPVRAVIKSSKDSKITADAHMHSEIELIRVLEGLLTIHFNNQYLTLTEGELIFINSMVIHSTSIPDNSITKIFVFQFNPSTLYNQPIFSNHRFLLSFINQGEYLFSKLSVMTNSNHKEIADLTDKVITEFNHREIAYEISIKSYLYRILSLLYRCHILQLNTPSQLVDNYDIFYKIEPIIDYTDLHFMDKISAQEIGHLTHFNYNYFCRLFKKATGKCYIDYLNYVRISTAEELLRNTDLSISIILDKIGFSNLSYFNKVFKNQNGISPSSYRKHIRSFI